MSTSQTIPTYLGENQIRFYANTFFGLGCWNASCWLINLEEWGADKPDEFYRRYEAWKKMSSEEMLPLQEFFPNCKIEPKWKNQTWSALHKVLFMANFQVGELNASNKIWGGSDVALIESMPFPASGKKHWPYSKWNFDFMKSRENCEKEFKAIRAKIIIQKAKVFQPKWIVDCGQVWKHLENNFSFENKFYRSGIFEKTLWISPKRFGRWIGKEAKQQIADLLKNYGN